VNASNNGDLRCVRAIERVNEAVGNNNAEALFEAIHSPDLNLADHLHGDDYFVNNRLFISEDDAIHVLGILREIQQNRSLVRYLSFRKLQLVLFGETGCFLIP